MPQSLAEQLQSIPMSPHLSESLGRAEGFAREQAHRALMLEHLLLALTEDPDAAGVLRACNVDVDRLGTDVSGYLGGLLEDMRAPPGTEPAPDAELMRVIEAARLAAQQSRRRAIDGAIVLAAIVGDAKSPAAGLLKAHGMTFEEAIRTLQKASAQARSKQYSGSTGRPGSDIEKEPTIPAPPPPPPPAPERPAPAGAAPSGSGQTVDEILAAARARIQQRGPGTGSGKPEVKPKPMPAAAEPAPMAEPDLPLMNLASFKVGAAPTPSDMPELPPLLNGQQRPAAPAGGPPAAAEGPPLPPAAAAPVPPVPPEPHLAPPRAFRSPDGAPRPPPPPPGGPGAPQQRPGGWSARGERLDATIPPPRRPGPAGGPPPVHRGAVPDGARASAKAAAMARGGQRGMAGPLLEAIPRRMRVGSEASAQVRIGRDKVDSLMQLLTGNHAQPRPEAILARALSVRLRAPDGGFSIEAASPETQWIEAGAGTPPDEQIAWRWAVTPQHRGRQRLQLVVSARTVGREGVAAETTPPERTIEVTVRSNLLRRVARWLGFLLVLGTGAALGRLSQDKLAQDILDLAHALVKHILGLLVTSGFLAR